jgi:hypothetical protein
VIGAAIAVAIIGAVRGLPDKEEREAAQGGALPILGSPRARAIRSIHDHSLVGIDLGEHFLATA